MNFSIAELPLPVRIRPATPLSDEDFMRFSAENRSLRMELEANGEILVMTPTGMKSGNRNLRIGRLLDEWAEEDGRGTGFDSSTGFKLANGAVRSPDAAWVANDRLEDLTDAQQESFGICPDFIIELLSPSDRLADARRKIVDEWIPNGVQLAWLIDPKRKAVEVYRPDREAEIHENPSSVQGTGPVRGFELVMARIWG